MTINADAFNFDALKEQLGGNPFEDKSKQYARDERFYVLRKDKDGNGAALIRFLPDAEKGMIQRLYKINTTVVKNGKKRFVNDFSPATIGKPCPFQERWQELWNAGDKEAAKMFGRSIKYVANIKVLKDPATPENEGKIFMYEMSGAIKDKIQNAIDPSEQDRSLGAKPKELFNPLKGNSFRLVARRGANGQINYDSSDVINEESSIYDTAEEALEDIKQNAYVLSDLMKPEAFLSYDELTQKLGWVTFGDVQAATEQAQGQTQSQSQGQSQPVTTTVAEPAPRQSEVNEGNSQAQPEKTEQTQSSGNQNKDLDSLLNGLM